MSIENRIIKLIQNKFFTEEHSNLDYYGKIISSRKYRKIYLCLLISYFTLLFLNSTIDIVNFLFKIIGILNIYFLGYLSRKINIIIKLYFKRNRPFVDSKNIITDEKTKSKKKDTFSFPSNSIQTSLIFYNVLFTNVICVEEYKRNLLLFLIIIIISLSKINRGLHYPTDIFFSIIIFVFTKYLYLFLVNYLVRLFFIY